MTFVLPSENPPTMTACNRCKSDVEDRDIYRGICPACRRDTSPIRRERCERQWNARDRINEIYSEMRDAIRERDKYRAERDKILEDARTKAEFEVTAKIIANIKMEILAMPWWKRLWLFLSPTKFVFRRRWH